MTARLVALVVDAIAPDAMASFWGRALRWDEQAPDAPGAPGAPGAPDARGVELVPTDGTSFELVFRPTREMKVGQNRIHLDLTTSSLDDQRATVAELVSIGARLIDIGQSPDDTHVVLADPEGNELCIIAPSNRFLAGCPRLGAVNCDGTRALGHFFSQALGWPLVWDQEEETAIQTPDGTGPKITWSGPPLMPRTGRERLHLHLAPSPGESIEMTLDHLLTLGATRPASTSLVARYACQHAIALADVDGNPLCLVER